MMLYNSNTGYNKCNGPHASCCIVLQHSLNVQYNTTHERHTTGGTMKKTNSNSTLEVWGVQYINCPETREPGGVNKIILQVEPTTNANTFIVEVTNNGK
jgi:hypothetical protein